jgi:hypothetical protein
MAAASSTITPIETSQLPPQRMVAVAVTGSCVLGT